MAQLNFYTPTKNSWWAVRLWALALRPRFTHTNFENGWGTVVDLGKDLPRGTDVAEAYVIRPVNGGIVLCYENPVAMDRISTKYNGKRTTKWRSLLYLLTGWKVGEIRNCATISSDWLRVSHPHFPECYTPDELWEACNERTNPRDPRWLRRLDPQEPSPHCDGRVFPDERPRPL